MLLVLALMVFTLPSVAQSDAQQTRVVLQNADVSVYRTMLSAGTGLTIPHPGKDSVVIRIENDGSAQVTFLPGGTSNGIRADQDQDMILVELQRHWDSAMKPCTFPSTCVRPIKTGGVEIGATESLFTNGFVSAFRHRIDAGGTLTSSYYSAKGRDRIVFVPLTVLHATFDGTEEDLKPQQVYFSEAKEVEVTGGDKPARWVVVRLNTPRDQQS